MIAEEKNAKVMKLRLELGIECADMDVLRKYGKVEKGITREILVAGDMTLHALHYAIQKAFGWQNSHLHCFKLHDDIFDAITEKRFIGWVDLCGLYFRFPEEEPEDVFWDDDYKEGQSFKTWLKRKYTGPYYYGGMSEHVITATMEALEFVYENEKLRIPPTFAEYIKNKKAKGKTVKIGNATTDDLKQFFMASVDELIERLPISEILFPVGGKLNIDAFDDLFEEKVAILQENLPVYADIIEKIDKIDDNDRLTEDQKFAKIRSIMEKELIPVIEECNIPSVPLTSAITYEYDYGDGWTVEITCLEEYDDATTDERVSAVMKEQKPRCIAIDGLPVCDDVGGPYGYTEMLSAMHGAHSEMFEYDDAESSRDWAKSMGWTGRMTKPEKLL